MQLISYAITHYFGQKYESFTSKLIAAIAIFELIGKEEYDEKDYNKLLWIEKYTHEDVMIPLYVLDRQINPSKKEFTVTQRKITIPKNIIKSSSLDDEDYGDSQIVTLTESHIQYYLCRAIREINDLVCRNIKDYAEEIKPIAVEEEEIIDLKKDFKI